MTSNFDKFVDLFLEAKSFTELPDQPPYGFWISPHGDFYVVSYEAHYRIGAKIISENSTLQEQDMKNRDTYFTLGSNKFLRVAKGGDGYYVDSFIRKYDSRTTTPFTPTGASIRTIKDIGEFYNMPIKFLNNE